ncbi:MAG: hypothetical protein ABIY55_18665 [Kofleriaceae bacterium]
MMKYLTAMAVLIGCGAGGSSPVAPGPTLAPEAAPTIVATTACYQGTSSGAGQHARTIARRSVDPNAREIVEDVVHDDPSGRGVKSFHVVMKVDGARFTMTEASGGFTGTGTLVGEPWRWTSWTSTSQLAQPGTQGAAQARIEVESHDELTARGMLAHKQIRKDGTGIATTVDELTTFDCAGWDAAKAQLAVPVLDDALCDRACRTFATLKYWAAGEAELAALPVSARDEARRKKTAELAARLDTGAPACIAQCRSANNAAQTACMAQAASLDQLGACAK